MPPQQNSGMGSMGSSMPPMNQPPKKSVGPIVGVIIIILVIILGGLYFWGSKLNMPTTGEESAASIMAKPDAQTESLKSQGTSDTVSSIETDLNATNVNGLNQEMGTIETQLNAQ